MHAASDGMYVEDDLDPNATMPVRTGPDIGMEAEYTNERCQVLGLTHGKLLRAFGGQTLLMLGDTHVRAMFVAAVATVRALPPPHPIAFSPPPTPHAGPHRSSPTAGVSRGGQT